MVAIRQTVMKISSKMNNKCITVKPQCFICYLVGGANFLALKPPEKALDSEYV